jgi:hypothetical protein
LISRPCILRHFSAERGKDRGSLCGEFVIMSYKLAGKEISPGVLKHHPNAGIA